MHPLEQQLRADATGEVATSIFLAWAYDTIIKTGVDPIRDIIVLGEDNLSSALYEYIAPLRIDRVGLAYFIELALEKRTLIDCRAVLEFALKLQEAGQANIFSRPTNKLNRGVVYTPGAPIRKRWRDVVAFVRHELLDESWMEVTHRACDCGQSTHDGKCKTNIEKSVQNGLVTPILNRFSLTFFR